MAVQLTHPQQFLRPLLKPCHENFISLKLVPPDWNSLHSQKHQGKTHGTALDVPLPTLHKPGACRCSTQGPAAPENAPVTAQFWRIAPRIYHVVDHIHGTAPVTAQTQPQGTADRFDCHGERGWCQIQHISFCHYIGETSCGTNITCTVAKWRQVSGLGIALILRKIDISSLSRQHEGLSINTMQPEEGRKED